ncbi:hypothetical protein B5X24_HaOG203079 [Helicoverpa armigera]|uniref:Uncharacterized protein n=1 Tax=Helicoverpa armigera TaxID=29058 RepID=A0A2W1BRJ3_HELAM|nr:hypothetical protein B5X24_HaOG203079 [Helicoverpa armigera]
MRFIIFLPCSQVIWGRRNMSFSSIPLCQTSYLHPLLSASCLLSGNQSIFSSVYLCLSIPPHSYLAHSLWHAFHTVSSHARTRTNADLSFSLSLALLSGFL